MSELHCKMPKRQTWSTLFIPTLTPWPSQENQCKSPVQNGFSLGRALHSIKYKITFFLWTFRVFRKILCQILTPSITASLLSWTIVSALSFPPTRLTIILLFPRLASCLPTCRNTLSRPSHAGPSQAVQTHPSPTLQPQPGPHTGTGTLSRAQQLLDCLYPAHQEEPALLCPARTHGDGRDAFVSPEQYHALGISAQNATSLNPANTRIH